MNREPITAQTLNSLLARLVSECGSSTALISRGAAVSFAELERNVRVLAGGLAELGISRGDRVAVWLPNVPAWVELEFALARLGAIAVAINTRYRRHEVEDIVGRSRARVLVLQPQLGDVDYLSLLEQCDAARLGALETLVLIDDVPAGRVKGRRAVSYRALLARDAHAADDGRPDLPCNAFTSSGTTSAPKLVLHSQAAIAGHALAVAEAFTYRRSPAAVVVLGMLPFCGVFGFNTVMGALAAGRPCVLLPAFDAGQAVDAIERHRVTHTVGTDEMYRRIFAAAAPPRRIASLKEGAFAAFGGDAVELVSRGGALGIKLFQTYGSSEVQALMAYAPPGSGPERWALGGGVPSSPDTLVRIRDPESGVLIADGERGEIEIKGRNVMIGYIDDPDAEKRAFTPDGYVRTRDLGYLEGPRQFVYLARLGDALRLGGFLVNPREIEEFLERDETVAAAQVVAVDTARGPRPVAFVVPTPGARPDEAALIRACAADMARFKVPKRVIALERFPTTSSANGEKIQKAKLREMAQALIETEAVR